jgi:hypothetical protein
VSLANGVAGVLDADDLSIRTIEQACANLPKIAAKSGAKRRQMDALTPIVREHALFSNSFEVE